MYMYIGKRVFDLGSLSHLDVCLALNNVRNYYLRTPNNRKPFEIVVQTGPKPPILCQVLLAHIYDVYERSRWFRIWVSVQRFTENCEPSELMEFLDTCFMTIPRIVSFDDITPSWFCAGISTLTGRVVVCKDKEEVFEYGEDLKLHVFSGRCGTLTPIGWSQIPLTVRGEIISKIDTVVKPTGVTLFQLLLALQSINTNSDAPVVVVINGTHHRLERATFTDGSLILTGRA